MPERFHPSDSSILPSSVYMKPGWEHELPLSTPQFPGKAQTTAESEIIKPVSLEEREIAAAHHALDALGVPSVADLDVTGSDEEETRLATHDLRVHGRIVYLAQRLAEVGLPLSFESTQTE